jgi:hypothetical protein
MRLAGDCDRVVVGVLAMIGVLQGPPAEQN